MRKLSLFLDTNVVLDAFIAQRPLSKEANTILINGYLNAFNLFVSASQITDFLFIAGGGGNKAKSTEAVDWLKKELKSFSIAETNPEDIVDMLNCDWRDYEDYLVYATALRYDCDLLITRNGSDFSKSQIPVMNEREFLDWYEKEYNIRYSLEDFANAY